MIKLAIIPKIDLSVISNQIYGTKLRIFYEVSKKNFHAVDAEDAAVTDVAALIEIQGLRCTSYSFDVAMLCNGKLAIPPKGNKKYVTILSHSRPQTGLSTRKKPIDKQRQSQSKTFISPKADALILLIISIFCYTQDILTWHYPIDLFFS